MGRDPKDLAEVYRRKHGPEEQEMPWQPNTGGRDVGMLASGAARAAHSTGCAAAPNTLSPAECATCSQTAPFAGEARSEETLIQPPAGATEQLQALPAACTSLPRTGEQEPAKNRRAGSGV